MLIISVPLCVGAVFGAAKLSGIALRDSLSDQYRALVSLGIGITAYKGLASLAAARGWQVCSLKLTVGLTVAALAVLVCYRIFSRLNAAKVIDKTSQASQVGRALNLEGKSRDKIKGLITGKEEEIQQNRSALSKEWAKFVVLAAYSSTNSDTSSQKKDELNLLLTNYQDVVELTKIAEQSNLLARIDNTPQDQQNPSNDPEIDILLNLFNDVDKGIEKLKENYKYDLDRFTERNKLLEQRNQLLKNLDSLKADEAYWIQREQNIELSKPKTWHWYIGL